MAVTESQRLNALKLIMQKILPEGTYEEYFKNTTSFKVLELLCAAMNEIYSTSRPFSTETPYGLIVSHVNLLLGGELHLYLGDIMKPNVTTKTIMEAMLFAVDRMWEIRRRVPEDEAVETLQKIQKLSAEEESMKSQINCLSIEYQQFEDQAKELSRKLKNTKLLCKELKAESKEQECEQMKGNLEANEDALVILKEKVENLKENVAIEERLKQITMLREQLDAVKQNCVPLQSNMDEYGVTLNFMEMKEKLEALQLMHDDLPNELLRRDEMQRYGAQYELQKDDLTARIADWKNSIASTKPQIQSKDEELLDYKAEEKAIHADLALLDQNISTDMMDLKTLAEDCLGIEQLYASMMVHGDGQLEKLTTISNEH